MIVASQMGGYLLKSTRTRVDIVGWVPAAGSYQILKDGATYGSPAFTFKYSDYADPVFVPEYIQSVSVSTLTTQLTPILANKADAAKLPGELVKFQDFVNKSNYDADSKSFLSTLSSLLQAMSDAVVKTDGLDLVPRGNVTMAIMISIVATGIISWLIFKGTGWQR
jgi:hypothetical protein